MKFKVTMKDPDTLHDAIDDAVAVDVAKTGLEDEDEREAVQEKRREKIGELCRKWFQYDEYLTVEIDTEAQTCTVVPNK